MRGRRKVARAAEYVDSSPMQKKKRKQKWEPVVLVTAMVVTANGRTQQTLIISKAFDAVDRRSAVEEFVVVSWLSVVASWSARAVVRFESCFPLFLLPMM